VYNKLARPAFMFTDKRTQLMRDGEIYLPSRVAGCQKRLKLILLATRSMQYKHKYKLGIERVQACTR